MTPGAAIASRRKKSKHLARTSSNTQRAEQEEGDTMEQPMLPLNGIVGTRLRSSRTLMRQWRNASREQQGTRHAPFITASFACFCVHTGL